MTDDQLTRLRTRIEALIDAEEDSVRLYRLCLECTGKVEIQGTGEVTSDPDVYLL